MKPINESGDYCPLWRKPCRRVCHSCAFWTPMPTVSGETKHGCAITWQTTIAVQHLSATNGLLNVVSKLRDLAIGAKP